MNTVTKVPAIAIEFYTKTDKPIDGVCDFYEGSLLLSSSEIDIYQEDFLNDPNLTHKTIYVGRNSMSLEYLIPEFDFTQTFDYLWWRDEIKATPYGEHFTITELKRDVSTAFFIAIGESTDLRFNRGEDYEYNNGKQLPDKMRVHLNYNHGVGTFSFYLTSSTSNHSIVYGGVTFYSLHTLTNFLDQLGIKWRKERVTQELN